MAADDQTEAHDDLRYLRTPAGTEWEDDRVAAPSSVTFDMSPAQVWVVYGVAVSVGVEVRTPARYGVGAETSRSAYHECKLVTLRRQSDARCPFVARRARRRTQHPTQQSCRSAYLNVARRVSCGPETPG